MVISKPRGVKSTFNTSNATSQKPGLFLKSERKARFLFKRQKKRRVAKPTQDFGLIHPLAYHPIMLIHP